MGRYLLIIFLVFTSFSVFSQINAEKSDTTEKKRPLSLEIAPIVQWNSVFDRYSAYGGLEVDIVLSNKYILGIQGEFLLGEFLKRVVFPNIYEFDHYKFGVFGAYQFNLSEKFYIRPQFRGNICYAIWQEAENRRFYTDDIYVEIRPEINIGYRFVKTVSLFSSIGYNSVVNLDMIGTSAEDLSGETISLGVRIRLLE